LHVNPDHQNPVHPSIVALLNSLRSKGPLTVTLECLLDRDWQKFSWRGLDQAIEGLALNRTNGYGVELHIVYSALSPGSLDISEAVRGTFFEMNFPACHSSVAVLNHTITPGDVYHEGWDCP
jgi:hypothetical protein